MPTQWVETDKNVHKRRDDKFVEVLAKSRLAGRGNFEDTTGVRTDSPASDVGTHNLIASWCACEEVADIRRRSSVGDDGQ